MDAVATDITILSIAAAADTISTHHVLSRCPSCYERNPLMQEPAQAILLKSAVIAGTTVAANKLRKDGHGRAAKVLRWTVTALWLGFAAHNMRQVGKK